LIKKCTCRDGFKCSNHPVELGCLLLGEGSKEIDTGVSRHVSVDEALAHVDKCIESGLIPFVGRFKADDYLWGVKDRGKLLTVCFCCSCCCVLKNSIKHLPAVSKDSVIKLKGLQIETDQTKCTACGECVDACFMEARTLHDGRILYNSALCKGCGKCMSTCPENAISMDVANIDEAVDDVLQRVRARIEIGCMAIGPAISRMHPSHGRRITTDEAIDHVRKASEAGLIPNLAHVWIDVVAFGLTDFKNLMFICFCDDCCCQYRTHMKKRGPNLDRAFQKLPGIEVAVNVEAYTGCGICAERCFVNAITIADGIAKITVNCKGCGQCVENCPEQAVTLTVANEDILYEQLKSRLYQQSEIRFSEDQIT